ncbi:Proteophosphoglycan ppg4 [Rhodotorula toruloides ATCC 204091]|uniref:Proteophosphoglycan ppg4 n=1 Tax=Rhodotorula toruloides TaxID=5286 RepID=A0A2T0ADU8_RHOTO|nr:Proteophosphoglycan ppg4 [Rhodotorula toruloides ATCC 204091]PRQ76170.1 Proteophosphoglycan ppg4 [Rhodotorula toruloides]
MSPSTESSSNSDAGADDGEHRLPKYRLDALPVELLKLIVVLVKEQDERLQRLPNLRAVRIDCYTWKLARGKTRYITPETDSDSDGEAIPPPPVPEPLDALQAEMAQEAFQGFKSRFTDVELCGLTLTSISRHLNTFIHSAALQHLSLSPWTQFYRGDKASLLQPLQSSHLVKEPSQVPAFVQLPSVRELSIPGLTPQVIRIVECMTPNIRTLDLHYGGIPVPVDFQPALLPHLVKLRIHADDRVATVFRTFVACPYTSMTWIETASMGFSQDLQLASVLQVDNFGRSLRFLRYVASPTDAASGLQEFRTICDGRGISFKYELGMQAVDRFLHSGTDKVVEKASLLRDLFGWAQCRVDWLERLGDGEGLQELARLAQHLKGRQVFEWA